ncbi:alpha/beta hydrolase [Solicola sp. PLA-1-18]|uniref:alpha/beta hydrolase n=1 Tax=Solicola sp. PLA-1-18 TaxID=3380532 RepID=UPI003B7B8BCC
MTPTDPTRALALDGGRTGALLVHGFTGSPASMTPWGRYLNQHGLTVRVPRLPGHGTTWQEMNRTTWHDWYAEVDAALTEIREHCDHVVVGGLSMGGGLALRLAEQRPDDVDALALVNPAVQSADKRLLAVPLLRHLLPSIPGIGNDVKKPGVDEGGYDRTPLHALHSMRQLWADVRAHLDQVRAPVLLLRSTVDHVVDPTSGATINRLVTAPVREVMLDDSYHVATLDNDAETIFAESLAFAEEHAGHVR